MNKITVSKLERAEHSGDWHDKPLRWQVAGPGNELQKFPTKRWATFYAKIRRHSQKFGTDSAQASIITFTAFTGI
jgi:hypothetical protein